jgi:hypothetical protein
MDIQTYFAESARTVNTDLDQHARGVNAHLGLYGEWGEVCEILKKGAFHGHGIDTAKLAKEIGDVLWYAMEELRVNNREPGYQAWPYYDRPFSLQEIIGEVPNTPPTMCDYPYQSRLLETLGMMAAFCNTTLEEIAEANIAKLRTRFPEGFSSEASKARVDVGDLFDLLSAAWEGDVDHRTLVGHPVSLRLDHSLALVSAGSAGFSRSHPETRDDLRSILVHAASLMFDRKIKGASTLYSAIIDQDTRDAAVRKG